MFLVEAWCWDCVCVEQETLDDVAQHTVRAYDCREKCVLTSVEVSHNVFSGQSDSSLFIGLPSSFKLPPFLLPKLQIIFDYASISGERGGFIERVGRCNVDEESLKWCAPMCLVQEVVDAERDVSRAHLCVFQFAYQSSLFITDCTWGAHELDKRQDLL